jgi:GTP-binding protein
VADEFIPTMQQLLARPDRPDHIVIETSGLALPQPLIRAFNWPEIKSQVTIDGVVTVADAAALAEGRFANDEAAVDALRSADDMLDHETPLGELFEDQLIAADLVILNKADVPDAAELAEFVTPEFEARGWPVFTISAVTREGLRPLTFALAKMVEEYRVAHPPAAPTRPVIRPMARNETGFTVVEDPDVPGGFIVRGERPERWVRQTAFDNDEAVGYLADRLARLGVEDKLVKMGAEPGASVTIGDVSFDWVPQTAAGVDVVRTGRGTDARLDQVDRVGADERRHAKKVRRGLASDDDF